MGDIKRLQRDIADLALVPVEGVTRVVATIESNIDALSALAAWYCLEFGNIARGSVARVVEESWSWWAPKPADPPLRFMPQDGQPAKDSPASSST
ncbi:MAG TPA: hypothetical protein VGB82_09995 [Alphaproteobacteria bacterium]